MPTIIDGYNVLRGCGFVGGNVGPGTLERARGMFVGLIAGTFAEEERRQIAIVFDSALRLPELPDHYLEKGIAIHFASGHKDADEMIIEMIQQHSHPKTLLIVSSDHQIQDAAKRRRANAIDSEVWYENLIASQQTDSNVRRTAIELKLELQLQRKKSDQLVSASETEKWVQAFITPTVDVGPDSSLPKNAMAAAMPQTSEKPITSDAVQRPSGEVKTNPLQRTAQAKRLQPTSFDAIAKSVDWAPKADDSNVKNPEKTTAPNSPMDDIRPRSAVNLHDIEDWELPELEIGKAVTGSALKHKSIDSQDLDQWLDEFDSQFESSELSQVPIPQKRQQRPKPTGSVIDAQDIPKTTTQGPETVSPTGTDDLIADRSNAQGDELANSDDLEKLISEMDPPPSVDSKQLDRWNRQIKETSLDIFPPGYGEDILFSETFQQDDRIKRKRK